MINIHCKAFIVIKIQSKFWDSITNYSLLDSLSNSLSDSLSDSSSDEFCTKLSLNYHLFVICILPERFEDNTFCLL